MSGFMRREEEGDEAEEEGGGVSGGAGGGFEGAREEWWGGGRGEEGGKDKEGGSSKEGKGQEGGARSREEGERMNGRARRGRGERGGEEGRFGLTAAGSRVRCTGEVSFNRLVVWAVRCWKAGGTVEDDTQRDLEKVVGIAGHDRYAGALVRTGWKLSVWS